MLKVEVLEQYLPIWNTDKRHLILKSGRGAGKSWAVAQYVIIKALERKTRILCTREIQRTIRDSVYKLLTDTIERYELEKYFEVQRDKIISASGSEIIFTGLWQHINEIKSMEGIGICWVEEAQAISIQSLEVLIPTIRAIESKILYTYNPFSENDAVLKKLIQSNRLDVMVIETSYLQNPFLSKELLQEAEYDKQTNFALYRHKWLGEFYELNEAQIFAGKYKMTDMLPDRLEWIGYGLDFGYAEDPNVLVKIGIIGKKLFILDEKVGRKIEIDAMPSFLGEIKGLIIADSARPELISYLRQRGYKIIPAMKGAKSILEGIEKIKNFEIYIYKECEYTFSEFQTYSWKVDKTTGKIIPEPMDKYNHAIDAIRYALEGYRKLDTKFIKAVSL